MGTTLIMGTPALVQLDERAAFEADGFAATKAELHQQMVQQLGEQPGADNLVHRLKVGGLNCREVGRRHDTINPKP